MDEVDDVDEVDEVDLSTKVQKVHRVHLVHLVLSQPTVSDTMRPTLDLFRRRRDDFLAVAFLIVSATALFADILGGWGALYIRDLSRYYYPTKRIVREVILGGEFPYWNRYYSAGQPMAANPEYEVFYPPQWLILLPDYDLGYRLHIVLHVWIAAIGMYAFLRSMRLRVFASLLGAMAFGFGGLFLSLVNLLPIMFCAAWMPLIFLFGRRTLLDPNWRDFSLAALMLGLQMLTAEPTTLLQTWMFLGFYGLYRTWYAPERRAASFVRNMSLVLAMGVAGLLVGGAQMFGALDHAGDSARALGFDLKLVSTWSMHPSRPLELLFPNFFGYIDREGGLYWASGLYPRTGSPFYFNIYLGLLTIAFALAAACRRVRGQLMVLALCAVSYLIAIGVHTPLLEFLYETGVAASIRYFEKFSLTALFAIIVLASVMFDRAQEGDRRVIHGAQAIVLVTLLFSIGFAVFAAFPQYDTAFRHLWGTGATEKGLHMIETSRVDWVLSVFRSAACLAVLEIMRRGRFGRGVAALTALFVVLDLGVATKSVVPRQPQNFYTPPPVAKEFEPRKQDYRIFHEADWYGTSSTAKSYFSTGNAIYWVVRNGLFPMTPATWGFRTVLERDYDKTALLPTVDLVDAMWKVRDKGQKLWAETFMQMSNAWYRASYVPLDEMKKAAGGKLREGRPIRFTRLDSSPQRYYFADEIVRIHDKNEFVSKLVERIWSPRVAFVHSRPFQPAEGMVTNVEETANRATLEVVAAGDAFLVMSVTPHKYWRATVDGVERQLEVVNIGYQGIRVGRGKHIVTMEYRNPVVFTAAIVSLVSFLLFALIAIFARTRSVVTPEPMTAGIPPLGRDAELER